MTVSNPWGNPRGTELPCRHRGVLRLLHRWCAEIDAAAHGPDNAPRPRGTALHGRFRSRGARGTGGDGAQLLGDPV